jgi:thymidylate synthase (FAD)
MALIVPPLAMPWPKRPRVRREPDATVLAAAPPPPALVHVTCPRCERQDAITLETDLGPAGDPRPRPYLRCTACGKVGPVCATVQDAWRAWGDPAPAIERDRDGDAVPAAAPLASAGAPCPICGGTDLKLIDDFPREAPEPWVICVDCGHRSPHAADGPAAWAAWTTAAGQLAAHIAPLPPERTPAQRVYHRRCVEYFVQKGYLPSAAVDNAAALLAAHRPAPLTRAPESSPGPVAPVTLLRSTTLALAVHALRTCRASHASSDTADPATDALGPRDQALLLRALRQDPPHRSILEHLTYTWRLRLSRGCLQEERRTRMASPSVESTRATLGRALGVPDSAWAPAALVAPSGDPDVDALIAGHLANMRALAAARRTAGRPVRNDSMKYALPEAWLTTEVLTLNGASLAHVLDTRCGRGVLAEYRALAWGLFDALPAAHQPLYAAIVARRGRP